MTKTCPNCSSAKTHSVYKRENILANQNVLVKTREEALVRPRGTMHLVFCEDCGLLFNASFDASIMAYGETYENSQNHSASFLNHIATRRDRIIKEYGFNHHSVVEIGCGDGFFLKELVKDTSNTGYGYDTALHVKTTQGNIHLINEYYGADSQANADVITCRHVVEHIIDNRSILDVIHQKNPKATYFYETPDMNWIIKNKAFYDIFYEHCSYFSQKALQVLFKRTGLHVYGTYQVFGDQYQWIEAGNDAAKATTQDADAPTLQQVQAFFTEFESFVSVTKDNLQKFKGKKAIWGAGAKGVTFANLIDPEQKYFDYVIDINPKKIGHFLPGTGHKIIGPDAINDNGIEQAYIMNPNYLPEIKALPACKDLNMISV